MARSRPVVASWDVLFGYVCANATEPTDARFSLRFLMIAIAIVSLLAAIVGALRVVSWDPTEAGDWSSRCVDGAWLQLCCRSNA